MAEKTTDNEMSSIHSGRGHLEGPHRHLHGAEQSIDLIQTGQGACLPAAEPEQDRTLALEDTDHYRVLVETMRDGAATLSEDGRVLYCNARFADMIDAPMDRVMGSAIQRYLHPDSQERFSVLVREAKTGDIRDELELVSIAGERIPAFVTLRLAKDGLNAPICLIVVDLRAQKVTRAQEALRQSEELTERKRVEEALREANLRLAEADRRKNEFLAMLSHELRNPLSTITNSLYVLERSSPDSDKALRARVVISRQAGQLSRLVDDLLDVTRFSRNKIRLKRQRLDLNELVRRTMEDHLSLFERGGIELTFIPAPRPIYVNVDLNRVAQIVGNLLQNAAKFTDRGGRASITVQVDLGRSQAIVHVADTGAGIEPEVLKDLFVPFMQAEQTLDRTKGGLGLGLALVRALVELHGGSITARSAGTGKGAEFTVRLPLDTNAMAHATQAVPNTALRRRILIVEDNIDAAETLRDVLEFAGHDVQVAYNANEGLQRAREYEPDVVLCDIGLPGMDGYDFARAFRAEQALNGATLVALTGYAMPEDLQRASSAGFDRHLAKPASFEKIDEMMRNLPTAGRLSSATSGSEIHP